LNDPGDRARFLDDLAAEVYTGDPFAFAELAALPTRHRPRALVSGATALRPGLRRELEAHFGCPVIDVYSLTESGPVAFAVADGRHEVLPPDLFVEILDGEGRPCPPGARGEIVLTGGVNPLMPLLRYRTGDSAALDFSGVVPALVGFEGRRPVRFRDRAGRWLNSVDVSTALKDVALPFLALHQSADGALTLRTRCDEATAAAAGQALHGLFGDDQPLSVEPVPADVAWGGKVIQYTSDLDP
jgi:phenylacetate-CoA ligase